MQKLPNAKPKIQEPLPSSAVGTVARRLLVRPTPEDGESWPGYLLRLANRNGYEGLAAIASILEVPLGRLIAFPQWHRLQSVGVATNIASFQTDQAAHPQRYYAPFWFTPNSRSRVCPRCISCPQSQYIMADWDRPLFSVCMTHQEVLADRCDRCHRPIDYARDKWDACQCGRHFSAISAQPIPRWFGALAAVIASQRIHSTSHVSPISRQDADAARLVLTLALASTPPGLGVVDKSVPLFVSTSHFPGLQAWFNDWPHAFRSQISQRFDLTDAKSKKRARELLRSTRFSLIERQFEDLTLMSPRACSRGRNRLRGSESGDVVSLNAFSKLTGIHPNAVSLLVSAGHLPVTYCKADSLGRRRQLVTREFADRVHGLHAQTHSATEVAKLLRCGAYLIAAIVRVGHVPAWTAFPACHGISHMRLRLEDIAVMLREFESLAVIQRGQAKSLISLERAISRSRGRVDAPVCGALLGSIRRGALTLYRANSPAVDLSGFSLDANQVEAWRHLRRRSNRRG